jgi:hypothetical protein
MASSKRRHRAMDEGPGEWIVTHVSNTQLLSIAFRSELIRCAV